MSPVRPLERDDLPEVAALYELGLRSGRREPPPGLVRYFERMLLDQPWVDPEIPSLVHTNDDGSIDALQASHVRRARFDGRAIRVACAGQLVAAPDARRRAVGAVLVNAYLRGPQDLTMTDGGTPLMREIWTRLGGEISPLACIGWVRPMRPGRLSSFLAQRALRRRLGVSPPRRRSDRAAPTTRRALPPSPFSAPAAQGLTHEPLTPQQLLAHLPDVVRGMRLYPAYDLPYLEWLFNELDAVRSVRGAPIAHLVRDAAAGRTLGWYVYHLMPGGISHVLQVAARERDAGRVLDHLLHHAWVGGTAVVRGRLEARLVEPLSRRKCILHHAGKALIHSRNGDLLDAVASGRGLWTRMDGELWMAFDLLSLERSPVPAAS